MSTTLSLQELYRPVEAPLAAVRDQMGQLWADALRLVPIDQGGLAPPVGGKLLRPAMCLLAAGAIGGQDLGQYVRCAASFEALHLASLAHDDVIDHALLRRGAPSLNGMWDNHAAVLGGDYLVARAVEMLCEYDSCTVVSKAITTVRKMAEGELYFFGRPTDSIGEEDCILLAKQKTASLFAEATAAPSYLIDSTHREALHQFGIGLGIAFQVIDDILDVTQTTAQLGKPSCGDVAEGKITLPIIYLREALQGADRARFDALRDTELSEDDRAWVLAQVQATGAGERADAVARQYTDGALQAILTLPSSPYRDSLEGMLEFVRIRVS